MNRDHLTSQSRRAHQRVRLIVLTRDSLRLLALNRSDQFSHPYSALNDCIADNRNAPSVQQKNSLERSEVEYVRQERA